MATPALAERLAMRIVMRMRPSPNARHRAQTMLHATVQASVLAFSACCHQNAPGNLSASATVDGEVPSAERGEAFAELDDACGGGEATARGAAILARRPYLQDLGSEDGLLLFTVHEAHEGRIADLKVEVRVASETTARALDPFVESDAEPRDAVQLRTRLENLLPGTIHCYRLSHPEGALTEWTGFRTPPATDASSARFGFIAFGDSGSGNDDQRTLAAQMPSVPLAFGLHLGDVAYDASTREKLERRFFDVYRPLLAHAPFYVAPGNHDDKANGGEPLRDFFALPDNGTDEGVERYYAFDWGPLRVVAIDTNRMNADQIRWLDAELAAHSHRLTVVFGHHPPYSCGCNGPTAELRREVSPLLERHGVELYLSGHEHDYQRHGPIEGVTYVVSGGGGIGTRPVDPDGTTRIAEDVIHFTYVEHVDGKLRLHAIDAMGREFDAVEIAPRSGAG